MNNLCQSNSLFINLPPFNFLFPENFEKKNVTFLSEIWFTPPRFRAPPTYELYHIPQSADPAVLPDGPLERHSHGGRQRPQGDGDFPELRTEPHQNCGQGLSQHEYRYGEKIPHFQFGYDIYSLNEDGLMDELLWIRFTGPGILRTDWRKAFRAHLARRYWSVPRHTIGRRQASR